MERSTVSYTHQACVSSTRPIYISNIVVIYISIYGYAQMCRALSDKPSSYKQEGAESCFDCKYGDEDNKASGA